MDAMADTAYEDKRIRDEAAGWYAKLNNTTISTETLRAFREWRNADERRAEAYREIEAFWRRAAKVENDPEIQRAIGEALGREKPGRGPLPRLGPRGMAGAALVFALGLSALAAWPTVAGRAYETSVGEQRFVRLADGSRVRLDTASKVRVKLSGDRRDIQLVAGRAFFDVAHDPTRPFVVDAGSASIVALGTRFAVARGSQGAEVTLLEGKVRVDRTDRKARGAWTLAPGDSILTGEAQAKVRRVDPAAATSWTRGQLTFRRQTLAKAAAEVNRYSERKVVIGDRAAAGRQISGVFDAGDTDAFVAAVGELYDLKAERRGAEIHLSPAA